MVILTCWVHLRIFSSWFFAIPPQVTAGTDVYRCSDRSAAYEIQNLLQGGSELYRNLLMYGTPDLEHVSYVKKHLFPAPLGGLEAATPQNGWTFVQIPGALKIPQNVFAIFFGIQFTDLWPCFTQVLNNCSSTLIGYCDFEQFSIECRKYSEIGLILLFLAQQTRSTLLANQMQN